MISKQAIKDFQNADGLDDHSWLKKCPRNVLEEFIKEQFPNFTFKTKPHTHQLSSFIAGASKNQFLYLLDMGTGKTKIALDLISLQKQQKKLKAALILVPNVVSISSWTTEVSIHSDLTSIELYGTEKERWELLREPADLYILNYTGLQIMLTNNDKGRAPDKKKIANFLKKFNILIPDEIHSAKNKNSLTFKLLNKLAKGCEYRYGLTGTPFGRDPIDLWAQFYLIDRGETLGETLGLFREAFFKQEPSYFGTKYKFDPKWENHLQRRLNNRSLQYSEDEIGDLPPKIYRRIPIKFNVNTYHEYYRPAEDGLIQAQKGGYIEIENSFIRLRQITSGFLNFKDDDDEKHSIIFKDNPKLEALIDLIKEMPPRSKAIVFNEFTLSGDMICKRLVAEKIKHERLYSGTKDKINAKDTFIKDPTCKVFVVNSKSGGQSLNLQAANYVFFYESPCSCIVRAQAEKRAHRGGQEKRVFIFDLTMQNSVDEKILTYLKEGKDLFQALVRKEVSL